MHGASADILKTHWFRICEKSVRESQLRGLIIFLKDAIDVDVSLETVHASFKEVLTIALQGYEREMMCALHSRTLRSKWAMNDWKGVDGLPSDKLPDLYQELIRELNLMTDNLEELSAVKLMEILLRHYDRIGVETRRSPVIFSSRVSTRLKEIVHLFGETIANDGFQHY